MVNHLLVDLTTKVLGSGKSTSRGNYAFKCPHCNHYKPKLEINFTENKKGTNPWHCWVCDKKGKTLLGLFKSIKAPYNYINQLKGMVKTNIVDDVEEKTISLNLPKEYKLIIPNIDKDLMAQRAFNYLKGRGIRLDDLVKYDIGYCDSGPYENMVIIPSYDKFNKLNYFSARSFLPNPYQKFKNPPVSRDIVPFESYINWNLPIILCEGMFDAIAIRRNAIPLLGKNVQSQLMRNIIANNVKEIYIALDKDAMKQAMKMSERFLNEGIEVYLVELKDKDPSDLGFIKFNQYLEVTESINEFGLMEKKLSLL